MIKRIGIYSGSFDPVHAGHVAFALEAAKECKLNEVIFLPDLNPPGKHQITDVDQRMTQLTQATFEADNLRVLQLADKSFTIRKTLPELQKILPGSRLALLMGSDVIIRSLPFWPDIALLLTQVELIIGVRSKDTTDQVQSVLRQLSKTIDSEVSATILTTQYSHLSSTMFR